MNSARPLHHDGTRVAHAPGSSGPQNRLSQTRGYHEGLRWAKAFAKALALALALAPQIDPRLALALV